MNELNNRDNNRIGTLNQQKGPGNQMMEAEGQQEEEMKLLDFNLTKIGTILESNDKSMDWRRKLNY